MEGASSMRRHPRFIRAAILLCCGFALGVLWKDPQPLAALQSPPKAAIPPNDGKLRIIAFGAHPDDSEIKVGGTAAKWAALGHHVKLVSVTNGDIGHWQIA